MWDNDFDKSFNRIGKIAGLGVAVTLAINIAVLAFLGWVVVQLLQHFKVICPHFDQPNTV